MHPSDSPTDEELGVACQFISIILFSAHINIKNLLEKMQRYRNLVVSIYVTFISLCFGYFNFHTSALCFRGVSSISVNREGAYKKMTITCTFKILRIKERDLRCPKVATYHLKVCQESTTRTLTSACYIPTRRKKAEQVIYSRLQAQHTFPDLQSTSSKSRNKRLSSVNSSMTL